MKKKRTLKRWVIVLFISISLLGIIYSSYHILNWKKGIDKNNIIDKKINKYIEKKDDETSVDFDSLKKENSDVVGYLTVNGTNINYVVVKGSDNEFYLNHNFYKEPSVHGWIFADSRNKYDGNDKNLIIYGHNTLDGSMFGSLKNVFNENWYKDSNNYIIKYITESGSYKYKVFSIYSVDVEEYYISTDFASIDDYEYFLKTLKSRSFYNYNVDIATSDNILTLSTCTSNGTRRVVLHAKLIK